MHLLVIAFQKHLIGAFAFFIFVALVLLSQCHKSALEALNVIFLENSLLFFIFFLNKHLFTDSLIVSALLDKLKLLEFLLRGQLVARRILKAFIDVSGGRLNFDLSRLIVLNDMQVKHRLDLV